MTDRDPLLVPLRDPLLVERQKTHGDFKTSAKVTQQLKCVLRAALQEKPYELGDRHKEALEMIFHKIGRIVAGNANFKDHWDDIAGYAKLVSEACGEIAKRVKMDRNAGEVGSEDESSDYPVTGSPIRRG